MPRDIVAQMFDVARDPMQQEDEMPTGKRISLKLTPQQKEEIMKATGKTPRSWSSASRSWKSGSRRR